MDPMGSWSAYAASYGRLNAAFPQEDHHLLLQPPHSTPNLLPTASPFPGPLGPMSPPQTPVSYESVFTPLYQKPYRGLKQASEVENYNSNFYDQTNNGIWGQNSPFGVLPHESVVPCLYDSFSPFAPSQSNPPNYDPKRYCPPVSAPRYNPSLFQQQNDYRQPDNGLHHPIPRPRQDRPRNYCSPGGIIKPALISGREQSQSSPISFAKMDYQRDGLVDGKVTDYLSHGYRYSGESQYTELKESEYPRPVPSVFPISHPPYPLPFSSPPPSTPQSSALSSSPDSTSMPYPKPTRPLVFRSSFPPEIAVPRALPPPTLYSVAKPPEKLYFDNRYDRPQWEERRYDAPRLYSDDVQDDEDDDEDSLRDLSSCRGDPMSLVKTLQHQEKFILEDGKPRKDTYPDPPPAHLNQQCQNGYFDAERWGVPQTLTQPKIPTPSQSYFPSFPPPVVSSLTPAPSELELTETGATPVASPRPKSPTRLDTELNFLEEVSLPGDTRADVPRPIQGFKKAFFDFLQSEDKDSTTSGTQIAPWTPSDPQDDPRYLPQPQSPQFSPHSPEKLESGPETPKPTDAFHQIQSMFPFEIGDFIVLKKNLDQLYPPIWRVQKNALLQQLRHFVEKGVPYYVNQPCFVGWSPQSKNIYQKVEVKLLKKRNSDVIVSLVSPKHRSATCGNDIIEESMTDKSKHQMSYEVYLQTLFSQALDSKFLREIYYENDEYFVEKLQIIDSVLEELAERLSKAMDWPEDWIKACSRLPSYMYSENGAPGEKCFCRDTGDTTVTLSGTPYDKKILSFAPSCQFSKTTRKAVLCLECTTCFEALHRLFHTKMYLFAICSDKVSGVKTEDPLLESTSVMKQLLSDEIWLNQAFDEANFFWGFVEKLIKDQTRKKKMSI